jgi:hypothetical protein
MTASKQTPSTVEQELGRELEQLQQSASIVADGLRSSNKALYKHFAELYMWWRSASAVDDYLDAAYATTGRKYKKKTTQGINFAPLFWLAWGPNNDLSDDKVGRWSRVLNALHTVFEAEKQYRTDSVAKLQNYIQNSGGVEGLGGYGKATDDELDGDDLSDEEAEALSANNAPLLDVDTMLARLYGKANAFYSAVPSPATIDLDYTIPVTGDGMGLVLVRKVGDRYQLVGASCDETMVKPLAMHTYLHDFAALPDSIRTIVETISTQCLPERLQHFHDALVDSAAKSAGVGSRKSIRRLMYVHARGDFVLSPMHADSGVVTLARPNQPVLANATRDAFLSTRGRRAIERRLIGGHDFNLYAPANDKVVPAYGPQTNLASHSIRLQHQFAPAQFLHLDFWPFHESLPAPRGQLISYPLQPGFGKWRATFSLSWFRKFALEFTTPWLRSHGTHIKRPHQKVLQLVFSKSALTVHFLNRDDAFEAEVAVGFGSTSVAGRDISVHALSKDLVIAMQGIADLGVVSVIDVEVDADVIAMTFSTTAAAYRLYIPTCKLDGTRSTEHFTPYEPRPLPANEVEDYPDDQREGDFDEAR